MPTSKPKQEAQEAAATESIALRAFAVVEQVARCSGSMSLTEIAHACNLPKPTAFRILNLLQSAALLRREPGTGRYVVGPRLSALGLDLWNQSTNRQQWRKVLQEAVDAIGESCNLTVLEDDAVLYLDRVETDRPLRLHLEPGTRVPLHCSGSGKLFLCQLEKDEVRRLLGPEPFQRFTGKTITTYSAFFKELAKVRSTMVGTHDSELFDDSVAIAVPIADSKGRIYAAVALHAPSSRASIKSCMQHLPILRSAAAAIAATVTAPSSNAEAIKPDTRLLASGGRRPTAAKSAKAAKAAALPAS